METSISSSPSSEKKEVTKEARPIEKGVDRAWTSRGDRLFGGPRRIMTARKSVRRQPSTMEMLHGGPSAPPGKRKVPSRSVGVPEDRDGSPEAPGLLTNEMRKSLRMRQLQERCDVKIRTLEGQLQGIRANLEEMLRSVTELEDHVALVREDIMK